MFTAPLPLRAPRVWVLVVMFGLLFVASETVSSYQTGLGHLYISVMWSIYALLAIPEILGMLHAKEVINTPFKMWGAVPRSVTFVAMVVTRGDKQNVASLIEVVESLRATLPKYFNSWKVLIVTELPRSDDDPMSGYWDINLYHFRMGDDRRSGRVELLERPHDYQLPNGTVHKARANQFALDWMMWKGLVGTNVWTLHMDDDTRVNEDTVQAAASFVMEQVVAKDAGLPYKLLAQGVLTYPRQFSSKLRLWLADAVRPGDDLARFAFFTGRLGTPRAGLHGELLLVRSDIEWNIGWDFGRYTLTEDAQFSMVFGKLYPGRSGWFAARCYGSAPETEADFCAQRARWAQGLLQIGFKRELPLKDRWLILATTVVWSLSIFQNVVVVLGLAWTLGSGNTSPAFGFFLPLWCLGMAITVTRYWEGLAANARASGLHHAKFRWKLALLALIAVQYFAVLEAYSGLKGLLKYLKQINTGHVPEFTIIKKTAATHLPRPALETVG